jgi:hypothetical protein
MTKASILGQIKRLAAANNGKPPGRERFEKETGIRYTDWYPHLWLRRGDALVEAGFAPRKLVTRIENNVLLEKYAGLVGELGRVPLSGELLLKAQSDPTFPSEKVFRRFGGKTGLIASLRTYCASHPELADVINLLPESAESAQEEEPRPRKRKVAVGYVYLMKSGRHFKIGRSNSVGRREWELGIKIPIPPSTLHSIETDDPVGVEAYWHRRFSDKRGEGEWFNLTADDIAAFKRWKKIA